MIKVKIARDGKQWKLEVWTQKDNPKSKDKISELRTRWYDHLSGVLADAVEYGECEIMDAIEPVKAVA